MDRQPDAIGDVRSGMSCCCRHGGSPATLDDLGQIKLIQSDWQGHPRFESNSTNVDILDLINNNDRAGS